MTINDLVKSVPSHIESQGASRVLIVGGAVRDLVLGLEPKDFDIEVYGMEPAKLEEVLSSFGKVSAVGRSFYCPKCQDVRKLLIGGVTHCLCEESYGRYVDQLMAVYGGRAILLGFNNSSLAMALNSQRDCGDHSDGMGRHFSAFIIPDGAKTTEYVEDCLLPLSTEERG